MHFFKQNIATLPSFLLNLFGLKRWIVELLLETIGPSPILYLLVRIPRLKFGPNWAQIETQDNKSLLGKGIILGLID